MENKDLTYLKRFCSKNGVHVTLYADGEDGTVRIFMWGAPRGGRYTGPISRTFGPDDVISEDVLDSMLVRIRELEAHSDY